MIENETIPVWEKLYQIISGSNEHVLSEVLDDTLDICQQKLLNVLLDFQPYTKESLQQWKKGISVVDDEMSVFINRMSKELDLDVGIAWSVICNFLIFRYYGKVDELKSIIRYEANVKSFIDHVWYFYTSDRMFLLKSIRFIFEILSNKKHIFFEKFNTFIKKIDVKMLWNNLIKTFELLITEIDREKSNRVSSDILTKWVQRNNREQCEVLLLMIHLVHRIPLSGDELTNVLKLFMRHGFGRHSLFFGADAVARPKDIIDIQNAEIGVVLTIVNRYWQNPNLCKLIPKQVEQDLEQYQMQGDNSAILFIWVVFKATLSDDNFDYCTNALEALFKKKVFIMLKDCVTLNIFQNCVAGNIVMEAVKSLFVELIKIYTDYKFIYEQVGLVQILCELFKRSELEALDNFGPFLKISMDMFPYYIDNFLSLVEAILTTEHHHKVLRLLHNCPSYCTELDWCYASDAIYSGEECNLFMGTDRFKVPKGTLTEKCDCYGENMIKYNYRYDYFLVIEQYMKSLTMWAINRASLLSIIKCSLFIYHNVDFNETFPLIVRNTLFPSVKKYSTAKQELKKAQTCDESILYSFLKEEEAFSDHKLLLNYTRIILAVLKKKIMYKEILYGGVWHLLNIIFVTHQQWNYDEAEKFQQVKILNVCLQIFTTVLKESYEDLHNEDEQELYLLVRDSFLENECVVNSLCSAFVKDKFYLQNLMHQESNWIDGPSSIVIDTIKLELTLLLLLFKNRPKIPKEHFIIDNRTHIFAKSASLYFVNPYNCTLAVLAGKFLEILARSENVPLMSCLGLDYDQIQTLFLERLRDPMEDDDVKITVLDIISSCILHQTGMTAAFFNVQSSKKWYDTDNKKKKLEIDTVANFMMDYLDNIEKSVAFLKSPLQVGILRVMAILWQCEKQHLIKEVTDLKNFWNLLCAPLYKPFDQAPLIYFYIIKIISIQLMTLLRKDEKDELFFQAMEKFFLDKKQLHLFQQYLFKIFLKKDMPRQALEERKELIESWAELLVTLGKQKNISYFPDSESEYFYLELCLDGIQNNLIHEKMLSTWLDFTLVIVDMFGLKFEQRYENLVVKVIDLAKLMNIYYEQMPLKEKTVTLTIFLKIITELKDHYSNCPDDLAKLLDEIGPLIDLEYKLLEEKVWSMLKDRSIIATNTLGPWALVLSIANYILKLDNCLYFAVWFANRKYLDKMVKSTCNLLTYKDSISVGKVALYGLTLYVQSPLAYDFLKINMLKFYDRIEPMVNKLLTGQFSKINVLDLKEAWMISSLIIKFNQAFIKKFKKSALDTCYAFLTLNEHILRHAMNLPENTVDFRALDLLTQTLIFYDDILEHWRVEWYRKSNKTYSFMIDGIRKVINSCIYLCLRPKHIVFYFLDNYYRLTHLEEIETVNELMIVVVNRLIGILGLAFSCLYKLNVNLLQLFDVFELEESVTMLIQNDFSVPRFDLPIPCDLTYGKLLCLAHFLCKTLNQIREKKEKPIVVNEEKYKYYIGLIEHQDPSEDMPNQKLSSFLRYLSEDSGIPDPWINNLRLHSVQKTADMLMLFIAQQAFLTIKILEPHQVLYYKRNLYSELQFFNEFVKKQSSELLDSINITSTKSSSSYKADMDLTKRYLLYYWGHKKQNDIIENNFLLIISYWFSNICQVQ
ncbi:hypothetical protein GWI33_001374 [Rhynchophorus ferrugineus]|uniref:Uncharacterized protein n=1 Tax=Rhynchophorus ferrugineus TaxID=354439 RepID=A0A834IZU5_RHYFE|nr:hypothetical protein GWI33_001374 [Rhynchophorus ferrugineus]